MRTRFGILGGCLLLAEALSVGTPPPGSKACRAIPAMALEKHFGAPLKSVRGSDKGNSSICTIEMPDRRHVVELTLRPPGPGSMTVEQRLAQLKPSLDKQGSQVKNYGTVACFSEKVAVTCFLESKGYVSLSVRSDNPKQLTFDAVKALVEKAADLRR